MKKYEIKTGDSFDLIKQLDDNSIDLIVTSPPYADIVNYGKQVSIMKPSDYVDWILPLFNEIYRVLKPSGSFILNINDKCDNKLRSTFIYELIYRNSKETKLKLYDTYIWHKKNGIPNGGSKRFRNMTEFIFHFCKDQNKIKFNMIMEEPKEINNKPQKIRYIKNITNVVQDHIYQERVMPDMIRPDNVFRFSTAGGSRENTIKHPAPFNKELPDYFIKTLTDEGDIVLDVFSGIGTTVISALENNRIGLGFELNETYTKFSIDRIEGNNLDNTSINKYSLDGEFIESYDNYTDAAKQNNISSFHNIIRCIDRNDKKQTGGFIWKKENKIR